MNDLIVKNVPFCNSELLAVQDKETGKIYAGINCILRELGFDDKQVEYRRDKRTQDKVIGKGTRKFSGTLLGAKTGKDIWCIDIKKLPIALAKIEITPKMENEMSELSEKLEKYQDECADILAAAFIPMFRRKTAIEELQELQGRAILEVNEKVGEVENRITRLENNMTITHEQIQIIKNRVNVRIVNDILGGYECGAYKDAHLRSKVYSRFNKDYCDYSHINARANTLASKFEEALQYIEMWEPDTNMKLTIQYANAQMRIAQ